MTAMTKSISIMSDSRLNIENAYSSVEINDRAVARPKRKPFVQTFRSRHVRARTVYCLLVTSIAFTFIGAIATGIELSDIGNPIDYFLHEGRWLPEESQGLKLIRFSSFVLFGITCSLALVTLVRRDKFKARLLSLVRDNFGR
jgi:hypothetical protein